MQVIEPKAHHVFDWVELAKEFAAEVIQNYGWGINEEDLHKTYHAWDKKDWGFLLEHEDRIVGVLAGAITPHFFDHSNLIFSEFMWYVQPEFRKTGGGLMLYRALVERCKTKGVRRIVMGHTGYMINEFECLYESLGFTYLQTHYEKVINGN